MEQLQIQVDTLQKTNASLLDGNNSLQVELEAFRKMKAEGKLDETAQIDEVDFERDENQESLQMTDLKVSEKKVD